MKSKHKPVLLQEIITLLEIQPGDLVVDATLGGGGHALKLLNEMHNQGTLIAIDFDQIAINRFRTEMEAKLKVKFTQITEQHWQLKIKKLRIDLVQSNFKFIQKILKELEISNVNAIYADLGFSSDQLEAEDFGLSFLNDQVLDMRLDKNLQITAADLLNALYEKELTTLFSSLGDFSFSKQLARKIIAVRKTKPFKTTNDLSEIIKQVVPFYFRKGANKHPEAKAFQALRIAVNDELGSLRTFLPLAFRNLGSGGKLAVISFHSGEDRIVKQFFTKKLRTNQGAKLASLIKPSNAEISENNRSRSAKLRAIKKI
ncbi:MAG: 16S rRNA (cytosine(1402)-N(4))-methyltransferase RsmH [bacterium]